MPVWLSKDAVLAIHTAQLRRHGGDEGVLKSDRLEAAIERPKTTFGYLPETTLQELAAKLAVSLAKGHPFVDGNKRTACVASLLFLSLNGIEIVASEEELGDVFIAVADGAMSEGDLIEWFFENGTESDLED